MALINTSVPDINAQVIQTDIMRYKKNKKAANFALLSIVFECFYFMIFYSFYSLSFNTLTLGISVVVNLIYLLLVMLAEEGVKNYNWKLSILLLAVAALQVVRTYYYPVQILMNSDYTTRFFWSNLSNTVFGAILIAMLLASAVCLVASAFFGYTGAKKYENFVQAVDNGIISTEKALKEEPEEENVEVQNA